MTLETGIMGEASIEVSEDLTAAALGSGNVNVFSTPAMIALMEAAAVNALNGQLEEGQTSVGTSLNVKHLAATPIGVMVKAQATLKEIDGRRLVFEVSASDSYEKIGEGTHERFIVDLARFESKVLRSKPATT